MALRGAEFWTHVSQRILEHLSMDMWHCSKSKQHQKVFTVQYKAQLKYASLYLETDTSFNEGGNFSRKKKYDVEWGDESASKKKKYNAMNERLSR